jgi:AcrR family transcriptional regulator
MADAASTRIERRTKARSAARGAILDAARRVAARDGARNLSLRGVAAEAGFAPAALYGYFAGKDELLLALASDDLAHIARAMRSAAEQGGFLAASAAALSLLLRMETMAAAASALPAISGTSESERHFNGRLIAALNALSDARGRRAENREAQSDVVLLAAALTGLAVMARAGRLEALGFTQEEVLARLDMRFGPRA